MNKDAPVVLVGTYRPENEQWIENRRLYNLPLPSCGGLPFHDRVVGIVLFAEGCRNFAFAARFRETVDCRWLAAEGYATNPGGLSHGEEYALYELVKESTPVKLLNRRGADIYVSSSRCPCVKIDEEFFEKPYPKTGGQSMPFVFDSLKPYVKGGRHATVFDPVQDEFFENFFGFEYGQKVAEGLLSEARAAGELTCVEICAGAGGQVRPSHQNDALPADADECVVLMRWKCFSSQQPYRPRRSRAAAGGH